MFKMHGIWVPVLCVLISAAAQDQDQSLFAERPTSVNATLGMVAVFRCLPSQGDPGHVVWRVNETYLNRLQESDIRTATITTITGTHNCLYIPATEKRNNTVIECLLTDLQDGKTKSSNATLTVQGILAAVGGLTAVSREGSLHLTWQPPFTLDITNLTIDILYCINVYNITHNSQNDLFRIMCNLNQSEYDFRVTTPSPCYQFKFEVIPINGAGNGTSNNISGYLFNAPTLQIPPTVEVVINPDRSNVKFFFSEIFHVCAWKVNVSSSDDLPAISFQLHISGGINITGFNITLRNSTLPFDRKFSIIIEEISSAGNRVLSPRFQLSTYDVQKTTLASDPVKAGRLTITCEFASNSSALGCLSILGGMSSAVESFHIMTQSNNTLSVGNLDSDNYTVVTFDIERNGLPGNRAAYMEEVELQNGSKIEQEDPSADTSGTALELFNNGTLCFDCNFTSGCVVLIHSTSIQQHISVKTITSTSSSEDHVRKCIYESICNTGKCTAALYKQSKNGIIDQPEPVVTVISSDQEQMDLSLTDSPLTDPTPSSKVVIVAPIAVVIPLALLITVTVVIIVITVCVKKKGNANVAPENDLKRTSSKEVTLTDYESSESPDGKSKPPSHDDKAQYQTSHPPAQQFTLPPSVKKETINHAKQITLPAVETLSQESVSEVSPPRVMETTPRSPNPERTQLPAEAAKNSTSEPPHVSQAVQGEDKDDSQCTPSRAPALATTFQRSLLPPLSNSITSPSQMEPKQDMLSQTKKPLPKLHSPLRTSQTADEVEETRLQQPPPHVPPSFRPKTANSTHQHKPKEEIENLESEGHKTERQVRPQSALEKPNCTDEQPNPKAQVIHPIVPRVVWNQ